MYSKIVFFIGLLLPMSLMAQEKEMDTLRIKVIPPTTTRIVLYSAEGAKQKYINYTDAQDGDFKLPIPKNMPSGMYRLVFNQKTMDFIDFLYFGKPISFSFDATKADQLPVFENSKANTTYFSKVKEFNAYQHELDSLQVVYFQTEDPKILNILKEDYAVTYNKLESGLSSFVNEDVEPRVKDLVLASVYVKPQLPIADPNDYLPYIKSHYFDRVDFNNEYLIHSSVLIDKVMDYVFYLTVSQDEKTQNDLYLKAVDNVLKRVNDDQLKKSFIQALLQSFAKDENIVLSDYLFDNYYNKLPIGLQNENYRAGLQQELKTAVGRDAPPIEWEEKGEKKSLSELEGYENYIVVFWSTSCPHCMREMPKFYEYIKDNEKVKVIMVSLETEESQGTWKSETYYYPEFSHVLALQKWENPMVRSYNVHATPSYFVLDADKRIIDKPYELLDLEVFFKDLKRKQDKK